MGEEEFVELVQRILRSVGPAVYLDSIDSPARTPSEPRESWLDLQDEAVAAAVGVPEDWRPVLARALLGAILRQMVYGSREPDRPGQRRGSAQSRRRGAGSGRSRAPMASAGWAV